MEIPTPLIINKKRKSHLTNFFAWRLAFFSFMCYNKIMGAMHLLFNFDLQTKVKRWNKVTHITCLAVRTYNTQTLILLYQNFKEKSRGCLKKFLNNKKLFLSVFLHTVKYKVAVSFFQFRNFFCCPEMKNFKKRTDKIEWFN